jgi:hypothetical protein
MEMTDGTKLLIGVLVVTGAAMAQKDKPKESEVVQLSATTSSVYVIQNPPRASYSEKVTKDGHYLVTFDDPNNEFRCHVTANTEQNRWEVGTFTIVCTRPHTIPDERAKP